MINIHPKQALILLSHMSWLHQKRIEYDEVHFVDENRKKTKAIEKEVELYSMRHRLPDSATVDDAGERMDMILEALIEPTQLSARELIGEPERIQDALGHKDRYVEVYGMISDREHGDHLQDRQNGDGEPDFYDFLIRTHELSEDDTFFEVDDVPTELYEAVEQLLCGFYQCESEYANN